MVQPGSRVSYRDLWRAPQGGTVLQTYRDLVKPGLAANQRLQDARDGNQQIGGALGKAERYLNMASLVAGPAGWNVRRQQVMQQQHPACRSLPVRGWSTVPRCLPWA